MHEKVVLSKIALITLFLLTTTHMDVVAWGDGGFSGGSCNPDYGTHDWTAEHALDYQDNWEHHIDVPFYYQVKNYYCGPAALQMVFDFYGENISQLEIAEVARTAPYVSYTDELRRAAHFSNLSTSMGTEMAENITGYTARKLGYASFERNGMTIEDLKSLIDQNYPIILLMWFTHEHVYGHYRVAVGYNETHMLLHDPWNNEAWGGEYGGPNFPMNYTFFLEMWQYSGCLGLFVSPWKIVLSVPQLIKSGQVFDLKANIAYPCPDPFSTYDYPASSCNATILLPEGINLTSGENVTKLMGTGQISAASWIELIWRVEAEHSGTYYVTVLAQGIVEGFVGEKPEAGPSYTYRDRIGGCNETELSVEVAPQIIRVPTDYDTIQGAINAANPGDTVYVYNDTYYEHVVVNKTVSLIGMNRNTTIIDGNGTGTVVYVTGSNVLVRGFTIRNGGSKWPESGVFLNESRSSIIIDNILTTTQYGVLLYPSNSTVVSDNTITDTMIGIDLHSSSNNTIYHNNLINNNVQVFLKDSLNNMWDDGYPSGGNYWSGYNGTDADQDGIGNAPYTINDNNRDNYPLMGFFSNFTITWDEEDYPLATICNSTILNFQFNASQKMISFNVTGKDGTTGFCRVTIPNILVQDLWEGNCTVLVDGNLPIIQKNWTDETNRYLYFAYVYDTHHVMIVPEFPVAIATPLIIIATLLAAVFRKKISNY